jgi:uncharacterized membrane protein YqiK
MAFTTLALILAGVSTAASVVGQVKAGNAVLKVQAQDLRTRAQIQRQEGRNQAEAGKLGAQASIASGNAAASASKWGAASTILTGATSLLSTKYGFGRNG